MSGRQTIGRALATHRGTLELSDVTLAGPAAAIDLGSNSFHLIIGRFVDDELHVVDRVREKVRLAAGIGPDGRLDDASQARALGCLRTFREHLDRYEVTDVRVAATSTFRRAANAGKLRKRAARVLGHPIRVISGEEEAALVYKGVHSMLQPADVVPDRRLVIDIGGGSTECIVGLRDQTIYAESFEMGCVSFSNAFFEGGRVKRRCFERAIDAANDVFDDLARFDEERWDVCLGSSGTARNLHRILLANGWISADVTRAGLERLRDTLVEAGNVKRVVLLGLKENRRPVLPGGLAILIAAFERFGISALVPARGALREGLLFAWREEAATA